jgi:hypothetical protein
MLNRTHDDDDDDEAEILDWRYFNQVYIHFRANK